MSAKLITFTCLIWGTAMIALSNGHTFLGGALLGVVVAIFIINL